MMVTFLIFLLLCILPANVVFSIDDYMSPPDIEDLTAYMATGMSLENAAQAVRQDRSNRTLSAAANLDERNARLGDAEMTIVMRLMEETEISFEAAVRAIRGNRNSSSTAAPHIQEDIDSATAALIARLEAENHLPMQATRHIPDSIFDQVQRCANIATHRATLAPLVTFLNGIRQGNDVHSIDTHVAANITKLPAIGNAFGVDNPNLGVAAIQAYLNPFTTTYTGYEGRAVSSAQLQGYITATLNIAAQDPTTLGIYSRITIILQRLQNEIIAEEFNTHIKHLFDAIAENYLTQGGCFQGVRNRAYIRYISILNILMGE